MTWQKGQSGNPKGRAPRGQTTAELLRAAGDLPFRVDGDKSRRERAVEAIWAKACAGDLAAFTLILERTEGKVPDTVNQNVTGAVTLVPWAAKAAKDAE